MIALLVLGACLWLAATYFGIRWLASRLPEAPTPEVTEEDDDGRANWRQAFMRWWERAIGNHLRITVGGPDIPPIPPIPPIPDIPPIPPIPDIPPIPPIRPTGVAESLAAAVDMQHRQQQQNENYENQMNRLNRQLDRIDQQANQTFTQAERRMNQAFARVEQQVDQAGTTAAQVNALMRELSQTGMSVEDIQRNIQRQFPDAVVNVTRMENQASPTSDKPSKKPRKKFTRKARPKPRTWHERLLDDE